MKQIYSIVLLIWYIAFTSFIFYILVFKFLEYPYKKRKITTIPATINPLKLSILLYNKVRIEAMISSIYYLIIKGKLLLHEDSTEPYLTISNKEMKLSDSQSFLIDVLINVIGEDQKVTLTQLENYSNSPTARQDFMVNYDLWRKMALKESRNHFLEPKLYYAKLIWLRNIGIVLFLLNLIFRFHSIYGYLLIIAVILLILAFQLTFKRTKEGNQLYHDFLSYKQYLEQQNQVNPNIVTKLLVLGPVLKLSNLYTLLPLEQISLLERIHNAIMKTYRQSCLYGEVL